MIAFAEDIGPMPGPREVRQEVMEAELVSHELKFAVVTNPGGLSRIAVFLSPQHEGVFVSLTPLERERLAHALVSRGAHYIGRDDAEDLQLKLFSVLGEVEGGGA